MLAKDPAAEAVDLLKRWQETPKPTPPKFATEAEELAYLQGLIHVRQIESACRELAEQETDIPR